MTIDDDEDDKATHLVVYIVTETKDDENHKGAGRPNAYWQQVRQEQEREAQREEAGFSGSFRAVRPVPHGGAASVTADDTIGDEELCWCGRPAGHHWPGKSVGAAHPKGNDMRQMSATIDRRDLRGYHQRVQDFLLQCINENDLKFRLAKNSVILFPPDGTSAITVYARNGDKQIRQLQKWYLSHVYEEPDQGTKAPDHHEPVEPEQIEELAKVVNDPNEHPVHSKDPEPPEQEKQQPPPPPDADEEPERHPPIAPPEEPEAETGEWRPYVRQDKRESENITTNGTWFRCEWCKDTDHPLLSDNRRSVGGHNRIFHTDTSNLYDPETRARATETMRANKTVAKVNEAIDLLLEAAGREVPKVDVEKLQAENQKLREELASLKAEHDEVQAKLALVRESLSL